MQTVDQILKVEPPIDPQTLSELSKHVLRSYLQGHDESSNISDIGPLWNCLIASALSQRSTEKYLTAACNCVSVFLLNAASSPVNGIKHFALTRRVWFEGFKCVQKAFDTSKTKPALQVLETLAQLLRDHPDRDAASAILRDSSQTLLNVLLTGDPPRRLKPSCISLSCFIKKTQVLQHLEDILTACINQVSTSWKRYQRQNKVSVGRLPARRSKSRDLFLAILFAIGNLETRSAALKLFSLLSHNEEWTRGYRSTDSAAEAIELFIRQNPDSLGDFADNVLPVIVDNRPQFQTFSNLYNPRKDCSGARVILYLSVLRTGRLKKLLTEDDLPLLLDQGFASSVEQAPISVDRYLSFRLLLKSSSSSVRLHAYNLLTASYGTNTIISAGALECLLCSFRFLHDDNDAYERGEILSITRRFLRRLDRSRSTLQKETAMQSFDKKSTATLNKYDTFFREFGTFLLNELDPGISYQRHILALQTLQVLTSMHVRPSIDLQILAKSLSSLVMDPFEDVRSLSSLLLNAVYLLNPENSGKVLLQKLVRNVEAMSSRTCRHDHADAASRFWAIIISQSPRLEQASKNSAGPSGNLLNLVERLDKYTKSSDSVRPSSKIPLHALLLGLAHSLDGDAEISATMLCDLLRICQSIWNVVQPQLCVDSPEMATEDTEDESFSGPKDLLAYSWRALRDSNLVLQAILRTSCDDRNVLAAIGDLCIEQLASLRHRGAFSTVAQTYTLCCEKVRASLDTSIRQLNDIWYQVALTEISRQSMKLTRRSAGLPAMISAILSPAEPHFFSAVYGDLKNMASRPVVLNDKDQQDIYLPQVHSLNCLKDIMTDSKFRAVTEQYLGEMLELAAKSLSSPTWAVRNCGLMLLRACMNRLAPQGLQSPTDSLQLTGTESTRKQPLAVAMNLLGHKARHLQDWTLRSEIAFAGLDLVKHIGLGRQESERLNELIYQHLGSSVWAIRDHAARVLAARVTLDGGLDNMMSALPLPLDGSENFLHGALLFYRYALEGIGQSADGETIPHLLGTATSLMSQLAPRFNTKLSSYTKAAIFDVVNDTFSRAFNADAISQPTRELLDFSLSQVIRLDQVSHSFLHSRALLCEVYSMLLRSRDHLGQYRVVSDAFITDLARDPDAARLVVERVVDLKIAHCPALVDLLVRMVAAVHTADIRALSMRTLAKHLESSGDGLSDHQAGTLRAGQWAQSTPDRAVRDASLLLESHLIRRSFQQYPGDVPDDFNNRVRLWLTMVHAASKDELEFPSRLTAAASLRTCGEVVRSLLQTDGLQKEKRLLMDMLSILYDQLNDDDEEVREIAEQTASMILQGLPGLTASSLPMCALSAREEILKLFTERFHDERELPKMGLMRIVGYSQGNVLELPSSSYRLFQKSVCERLDGIRLSLKDLFAEEKQNLYIDEFDEVKKWTNVLDECNLRQLDAEWWKAAAKWCAQGLETLSLEMKSEGGVNGGTVDRGHMLPVFHPLGLTYNVDVLLLVIRVTSLARTLLRLEGRMYEDNSRQGLVNEKDSWDEMKQALLELTAISRQAGAHRRVIESLDELPGSVRE